MKYSYKTKSWSVQAREMANTQFKYYKYACEHPERVETRTHEVFSATGEYSEVPYATNELAEYIYFFHNSYRPLIVRMRALKSFIRKVVRYYKTRIY